MKLKIKAFILLLALSVYYLDIAAAVTACRMIEKRSGCCKKTMTEKSKPGKCPSNSTDGCKTVCITCPQFYTAIISPVISLSFDFIQLTKNSANYNETITGEFYAKSWKPPDDIIKLLRLKKLLVHLK